MVSTEKQSFLDTLETSNIDTKGRLKLLLGSIGIVYGDIGTSPIYAFKSALHISSEDQIVNSVKILGVVSLIVWALVITVTLKYILFVLKADNRGEGGILSLVTLLRSTFSGRVFWLTIFGIVGAALFFGDAVITPATSVLSAVEGLEIVAPSLTFLVVPLTVSILILLFSIQRFGTDAVSYIFGPVMLIWFLLLGAIGIEHIVKTPAILWGLSPLSALYYVLHYPFLSFAALGGVFLAVTGAEALYADLGYFGRRPIVLAWLCIVFPCLILNYMGQGAFALENMNNFHNPFFEMFPSWALMPMIILAIIATVIASQSIITGAFSVAHQAVQLNFLPRMEILHTSAKNLSQIYIPRLNFLLACIVIILIVLFEKSSKLSAAYGIAVTGNMIVTTVLLTLLTVRLWDWKKSVALCVGISFLVLDLSFLVANLEKFHEGAWASICIASFLFVLMWVWIRGSNNLDYKTQKSEISLYNLVDQIEKNRPRTVPGTAVFLTADPKTAPNSLRHSFKHYKILHEKNVILTVVTATVPRIAKADRIRLSQFNERFLLATLTFGYMEQPNIPKALLLCKNLGLSYDSLETSFFLSRRSIKIGVDSKLPLWQSKFFVFLCRTAYDTTEYFQIPTGRIVEIGTQIKI